MKKDEIITKISNIKDRIERLGPLARAVERVGIDMKTVIEDELVRITNDHLILIQIKDFIVTLPHMDEVTSNSIDEDQETFQAVFQMLSEAVNLWETNEDMESCAAWLRACAGEGALRCRHLEKAVSYLPDDDRRKKKDILFKGPEKRKKDRRRKDRK